MGSPLIEKGRYSDEMQHKKCIDRSFAISSKHVTMEEFKLFAKDYEPSDHYKIPNLPAIEINWASAAQYCNWLSKNEGIPEEQWCYLIEENEIFLKPNYLSLNGYRLPTEAEMEYATRAGTSTARFFGEAEELLEKHAWFLNNSQDKLWPVGSLKPNGFGFFDVYGNVSGWCQNVYSDYQVKTPNDKEGDLKLFEGEALVLRGGTRFDPGKNLRSAIRIFDIPSKKSSGFSFRVAKTLSPQ
jgi:formylglycine-generating enzyme required for sulfatase activity